MYDPRCLTSNPTTFLVNSVSSVTNGNSNYDTSSQPKSEYFGSPAQALSTHEVSIEDSFQIVSVILENSNIEGTDNSSGSLSDSESGDEHLSFSLALRTWCDQSGTLRELIYLTMQVEAESGRSCCVCRHQEVAA